MTRRPPKSTFFPYTTLFRSVVQRAVGRPTTNDHAADAGQSLEGAEPLDQHVPFADLLGGGLPVQVDRRQVSQRDRKSTRLNSSHTVISYAVFCLKTKKKKL